MSLPERAPDNQPTESIRTMLRHAKARQYEWERSLKAGIESVERLTRLEAKAREDMNIIQRQLAIRLAEGEQPQEVNGL